MDCIAIKYTEQPKLLPELYMLLGIVKYNNHQAVIALTSYGSIA